MAGDFARAIAQVFSGAFLGVLAKALLLTLAALAGLVALAGWLASGLDWTFDLPRLGEVSLGAAAFWGAVGLALLASAFLMFPVAALVLGFFLEDVARAVEARHYPGLPPVRAPGWGEVLGQGLGFLGLLLLVNALLLLLGWLAGPALPLLFWAGNGWLLGREYFQLAALRRLGPAEARALRRRHGAEVWIAGTLLALPLTVPLLGLLVPVIGAAAFTHMVERLRRAAPPRPG